MPNFENHMNADEAQALSRLIAVAQSNTGQSETVANFLLSWWNAQSCGGFALNGVWGLDDALVRDVQRVFSFICRKRVYPDTLGLSEEFEHLVQHWRPHLRPPSVMTALSTTDGRIYKTRVVNYSNAPGYRDINIHIGITDDERKERELEINVGAQDAIDLMHHVRHVNELAWSTGKPIDVQANEKRPAWLRERS